VGVLISFKQNSAYLLVTELLLKRKKEKEKKRKARKKENVSNSCNYPTPKKGEGGKVSATLGASLRRSER
jgi:hypothetical protein